MTTSVLEAPQGFAPNFLAIAGADRRWSVRVDVYLYAEAMTLADYRELQVSLQRTYDTRPGERCVGDGRYWGAMAAKPSTQSVIRSFS